MPDFERIKKNIGKMLAQGAPEGDVDAYVAAEGVTPAQLRAAPKGQAAPSQNPFNANVPIEQTMQEVRGDKNFSPPPFISPNRTLASTGKEILSGVPLAARTFGGMAGGAAGGIPGAILVSELFGQAADIPVDAALGRPAQTPVQRGVGAIENMGIDALTQGLVHAPSVLYAKARNILAAPNAPEIVADLKAAGVSPAGMAPAVGSGVIKAPAGLTKRMAIGGDIWANAIAETQDDILKSFEKTRGALGMATEKAMGGEAVLAGIDSYAKRSGVIADRLYGRVRGLDKIGVDISETQFVARKLLEQNQNGLNDPATRTILEDIISRPRNTPAVNMGQIVPFAEAKALRSDLLSIARQQNSLMADKAESAGKLLAKTLDADIEKSATALAPSQYKRWQQANTFYKTRAQNLAAIDQIWKSDSGQKAFNAAIQGAADGPARIDALKRVVPKDQWDEFRAVWLHQMGLEGKGTATEEARQFSSQAYLANYANLSDKSKDSLFGGAGGLRKELDRLARIAGYEKEGKVLASGNQVAGQLLQAGQVGTALSGATLAATGHPVVGAATFLLPTVGVAGSAKLMTSPAFVQWLADGARMEAASPNALRQHFARLAQLAAREPSLRGDISTYLSSKQAQQ